MTVTRRPTQLSRVARGFGGRSMSDDRPGRGAPQNRAERSTAYSTWADAAHFFQDDEQDSFSPADLWERCAEAVVALLVVVAFAGTFTALMLWLATTR